MAAESSWRTGSSSHTGSNSASCCDAPMAASLSHAWAASSMSAQPDGNRSRTKRTRSRSSPRRGLPTRIFTPRYPAAVTCSTSSTSACSEAPRKKPLQ